MSQLIETFCQLSHSIMLPPIEKMGAYLCDRMRVIVIWQNDFRVIDVVSQTYLPSI